MAYGFLHNVNEVTQEVQLKVQKEIVTVTGEQVEIRLLKEQLDGSKEPVLVSYNEKTLELSPSF